MAGLGGGERCSGERDEEGWRWTWGEGEGEVRGQGWARVEGVEDISARAIGCDSGHSVRPCSMAVLTCSLPPFHPSGRIPIHPTRQPCGSWLFTIPVRYELQISYVLMHSMLDDSAVLLLWNGWWLSGSGSFGLTSERCQRDCPG